MKTTVTARIRAPLARVWAYWTLPEHVRQWNSASDDWHTPTATSDLRPGGTFVYRMESRDGKAGFDFSGVYETVEAMRALSYRLEDDRRVTVGFQEADGEVVVTETFDTEQPNTAERQREGWQAILDHFKRYVEESAG